MIRKCRRLSLSLLAVLALTAVTASAASAQFTSGVEHTVWEGSQKSGTNDVFTMGSGFGATTCEIATFKGTTATKNEAVLTMEPTYSNCRDSLGREVDIEESLKSTYTANGNVHLSGSLVMRVTNSSKVAVCTITTTVPQTNNGITYKNLGGSSGVEITIHTTNLQTTVEGGFFNCGTSTTNATAGTYDGVHVLTGTDTSGSAVAINVD